MISEEIMNQLVPQVRGGQSGFGDLGEIGSFRDLNEQCIWLRKNTDLADYGESTVLQCEFISTNVDDPYVIKTTDDTKLTLTGEYGLATFDRLSYEFKDIETNSTFKIEGWPPTDPRAKYMFRVNQDPRLTRDVDYIVDFIIEFNFSPLLVMKSTTPPTRTTPAEIGIITDIATNDPLTYNFYVDIENEKAYRKDRVRFVQTVRNYSFERLGAEIGKIVK